MINTMGLTEHATTLLERTVPFGDCAIYTGGAAAAYPSTTVDGRSQKVHRVVYEGLVGEIPDGLTLDHVCFTTRCINPEHLRVMSREDNAARQRLNHNARKDHCPQGHAYAVFGYVGTQRGGRNARRKCRECARVAQQQYVARRSGGE